MPAHTATTTAGQLGRLEGAGQVLMAPPMPSTVDQQLRDQHADQGEANPHSQGGDDAGDDGREDEFEGQGRPPGAHCPGGVEQRAVGARAREHGTQSHRRDAMRHAERSERALKSSQAPLS